MLTLLKESSKEQKKIYSIGEKPFDQLIEKTIYGKMILCNFLKCRKLIVSFFLGKFFNSESSSLESTSTKMCNSKSYVNKLVNN